MYSICHWNKNNERSCPFINTLRPRQNGRHFPDDSFKWIFLNENVWISIEVSLKFAPKGPINNIPALVQIMAWRRPGDKPLSEPMMVSLLTHICVTRPHWVKTGMEYVVSYHISGGLSVYVSMVNRTLTRITWTWILHCTTPHYFMILRWG